MNNIKVGDKLSSKQPLTVKHVDYNYGCVSFKEIRGQYDLYKFRPYESCPAKQPHKHYDLIIAWAKGAEIQVLGSDNITWYDVATGSPVWCNTSVYRLKPDNTDNTEIDQIEKEIRKLADRLNELKQK